jgi:hypothetical protein
MNQNTPPETLIVAGIGAVLRAAAGMCLLAGHRAEIAVCYVW